MTVALSDGLREPVRALKQVTGRPPGQGRFSEGHAGGHAGVFGEGGAFPSLVLSPCAGPSASPHPVGSWTLQGLAQPAPRSAPHTPPRGGGGREWGSRDPQCLGRSPTLAFGVRSDVLFILSVSQLHRTLQLPPRPRCPPPPVAAWRLRGAPGGSFPLALLSWGTPESRHRVYRNALC